MKSFSEYLELTEDLITFNNRAYPRFGNIVILAGGAGSGKGFILKNLIGIEGKVLDVDATKEKALRAPNLIRAIKQETGEDLSKLNLRNPDDVAKLHVVLKKSIAKLQHDFYVSVAKAHPERLPNIVFDVTLKDWRKFANIIETADMLGYDKRNIHLVWIVNDVDLAREQNANRDRVVADKILVQTHLGAARTMKDIMQQGSAISKFLDGDIWLAFANRKRGDTTLTTSKRGGSYISKSTKIKIKKAGQGRISAIPQEFLNKLVSDTKTKF